MTQLKTPPGGGAGTDLARGISSTHYTPYHHAAASVLCREVGIIVAAADRLASGYGLDWSDYSRLHEAHQFTVRVLADLKGVEVHQ